jgi:hypothetical protein
MEVEGAGAGAEAALTDQEIDGMKVVDLKSELEKNDLDTTGLKADLADRLKKFMAKDGAGDDVL